MNIAIFHELHNGGARRSVNELAKRLKANHHVDLYYIDEKKNPHESIFFHDVYFFPFIGKKWLGKNWKVRLYKDTVELLKLYFLHKQIATNINKKKYDVVFIHPSKYTQAPFILRFIKGIKIYYCQEPLRLVYDQYIAIKQASMKGWYELMIRAIRKQIDKKNVSYASLLLCNSFFSQKNIQKAYGIRAIVAYLGVDTKVFNPDKRRRDIDILFISKQGKREDESLIKRLQNALSKRYQWVTLANVKNFISDEELKTYYQRAKIVLCLSRNEPFGLIPLEAAASGCVTIALNEGGFKESIIGSKTGYLVEPDAKLIERKISTILSKPLQRNTIGINARANVIKNWTWELAAERIEKVMKKIVKNNK